MATLITFNGSSYSVPAYNDTGWAVGQGNLSSYLVAIASGSLQTTGGSFVLSADVNFGASYGLLISYLTSVTASPATSGVLRLAATDTIDWGTANNYLGISGTALQWNGVNIAVGFTEYRETYTAGTAKNNYTGSLTAFALVSAYTANGVNIKVFTNGLLNAVTLDYAETNTTTVTFNTGTNVGDRVDFLWSKI